VWTSLVADSNHRFCWFSAVTFGFWHGENGRFSRKSHSSETFGLLNNLSELLTEFRTTVEM
jgi:hypothetical protein